MPSSVRWGGGKLPETPGDAQLLQKRTKVVRPPARGRILIRDREGGGGASSALREGLEPLAFFYWGGERAEGGRRGGGGEKGAMEQIRILWDGYSFPGIETSIGGRGGGGDPLDFWAVVS